MTFVCFLYKDYVSYLLQMLLHYDRPIACFGSIICENRSKKVKF